MDKLKWKKLYRVFFTFEWIQLSQRTDCCPLDLPAQDRLGVDVSEPVTLGRKRYRPVVVRSSRQRLRFFVVKLCLGRCRQVSCRVGCKKRELECIQDGTKSTYGLRTRKST